MDFCLFTVTNIDIMIYEMFVIVSISHFTVYKI